MFREGKVVASPEEINSALQNLITQDFYKLLIAYSSKRLFFKFGIVYDQINGIKGIYLEDIISELFISFLNNDSGRNWYKDEFPDFKDQFFSALDSQIYNTVTKKGANKTNDEIENFASVSEPDETDYRELYKFSIAILESMDADIDELMVFECLSNGLKRNEIAQELEITPEKVTAIKKRLNRKLILLRKKLI